MKRVRVREIKCNRVRETVRVSPYVHVTRSRLHGIHAITAVYVMRVRVREIKCNRARDACPSRSLPHVHVTRSRLHDYTTLTSHVHDYTGFMLHDHVTRILIRLHPRRFHPESFQVVEFADRLIEDMNHHVAIIDEHPMPLLLPFYAVDL